AAVSGWSPGWPGPDVAVGGAARRRRRALGLAGGIDPAAVCPALDLLVGLELALAGGAAVRRLDMPGRAAETVVQIEMAKSRIQIVLQQQNDHLAPEHETFRVGGRTAQQPLGLGELVDLLGGLLAVGGLFGRLLLAVLGQDRIGEGK